jgi:hypothetical protein
LRGPAPAVRAVIPGGMGTIDWQELDEGEIMTTLGKILVFLVFVAALALGGLMIYVSRTAPNWNEAVQERDKYITVLKANAVAESQTRDKWIKEYEKMKQLLDAKAIEANAVQLRLQAQLEDNTNQRKKAEKQQELSDLNHKQAQLEAERLQQELKFELKVVEEREQTIAKLQSELVKAINETQAAKNAAETLAARNNSLIEKLRELETVNAKLREPKDQAKLTARVTDPNYTNPPPVYVKGTVEEVDSVDKKLVTISVGSDNGVKKDMTLEVFRMSPKAEYLGRLLIVDANYRTAVGRLLPQAGSSAQVTLRPGDEVASKLRRD